MAPRVEIIQRVKHDVKRREPIDVKLAILDIGVIRFELCLWLELMRNFLRYLNTIAQRVRIIAMKRRRERRRGIGGGIYECKDDEGGGGG